MSKISILRKVSLHDISEGWDERCYINLKPLSISDIKSLQDLGVNHESIKTPNKKDGSGDQALLKVIDLIKDKFENGKGMNAEGEIVSLDKDDLDIILPLAITRINDKLIGRDLKESKD